jgi:SAM-dependent methyltransferase
MGRRVSVGTAKLDQPVVEALPPAELDRIRNARQHPRRTQFDYLHLRRLRDDIADELRRLPPGLDVLDLYCGTRPYDDLLPPGSRCTGLDIDGRYGAADLVTTEFLPFEDDAFDLVACYEGFHYIRDPAAGIAEIGRVLRPGGRVLISVPHVWEYDPDGHEHRFTGPELRALLSGWDDVRLTENGGRGVAWATQTGRILDLAQTRFERRLGRAAGLVAPLFGLAYLGINGLGIVIERSLRHDPMSLPMNLMITARRR